MAVWIARFLARAAQVEKATNTARRINQRQLANLAGKTIVNTKFEIDVRDFERMMQRYRKEVNYTLAEVPVKRAT